MGHYSESEDPGSMYALSFQSYLFPPLKFALLLLIYSIHIYSVPISHTVWDGTLIFAHLSVTVGEVCSFFCG